MPVGSIYILNLEDPVMATVVIFLSVNLSSVWTSYQIELNCWNQRCQGHSSGGRTTFVWLAAGLRAWPNPSPALLAVLSFSRQLLGSLINSW